ncbi:hypothetical protein NL676_028657 [Syzygium grande]|nr:hypothetical protein NL676_028657 [Syzygium grande]
MGLTVVWFSLASRYTISPSFPRPPALLPRGPHLTRPRHVSRPTQCPAVALLCCYGHCRCYCAYCRSSLSRSRAHVSCLTRVTNYSPYKWAPVPRFCIYCLRLSIFFVFRVNSSSK